MKIILVGGTGTIGKKLVDEFSIRHEVITASRNNSAFKIDLTDRESIVNMYEQTGPFDAVVVTAGSAYFGPFNQMTEDDFYVGIKSKMMGQINLVMVGKEYINSKGSFTLTTGILSDEPIKNGLGLSVANGAINAFVMAAAPELEREIRLNVVSPGMVEDAAEKYGPFFPGHMPVSMERTTKGYVKSVEGIITGQVIRIY